jgi:superfamily I DNA and RNA helicase
VLESNLGRHDELRRGRHLAVTISTATVFATQLHIPPATKEGIYCSIDEVANRVGGLPNLDDNDYRALQGALQRVSTIKPAKRRASVQKSQSRGATLKEIEKGISNLDSWQKRAAIESPDGPQRIRGLAGSGKTVVLALKAAYLHAQHPEWRIAVTFQSRSLYQQFVDLVTRFTFEHSNDAPDFDHLQIMHAWGSSSRPGVYSTIASELSFSPRIFAYAKAMFGQENAFKGICQELLDVASEAQYEPIFDAVLIDEAQDLPPEFFQLTYKFTRDPKRIIWAYDELQKLSEAAMPTTAELFGLTPSGEPLVNLTQHAEEAARDIVLPVCYRKPPWSLATAHALGFGIYREGGLVQHFDDPQLWRDIGYNVLHGELVAGERVEL